MKDLLQRDEKETSFWSLYLKTHSFGHIRPLDNVTLSTEYLQTK